MGRIVGQVQPLAAVQRQLAETFRQFQPALLANRQLAETFRQFQPALVANRQLAETFRQFQPALVANRQLAETFRQFQPALAANRQIAQAFSRLQPIVVVGEVMSRFSERTFLDAFASQSAALRSVAAIAARAAQLVLPKNLRGIEGIDLDTIDPVIMDDGISLYGVPRATTARDLIRASSRAERREILGRRWRSIANDCEKYLEECHAELVSEPRRFAMLALSALRDGHPEAAQALTANLLDTLVSRHFQADRHVLIPSQRVQVPEGYETFIARKYLAVAPIWSAYQQFRVTMGDDIPRNFSRHATAHAVTGAQMSRRNAIQGLMLVTGLIGYLDEARTGDWR